MVPSGVTERKTGPADKPDMVSVDVINFKDSGIALAALLPGQFVGGCVPNGGINPYIGALHSV